MAIPKSREMLFRLLQGEAPSIEDVEGLVKAFQATKELEGQWFDLKAGAVLQKKQAEDVRASFCGFANAEGGFLLIGYDEGARTFDGVAPVGKQEPEHWVADALGSLAHSIPPPRYFTLPVASKPVLIAALERARALVSVIEHGAPVYYLRFGHQTLPMPQSLVADLMLGRRSRPEMRVRKIQRISGETAGSPHESGYVTLVLSLLVDYENDALTVAETVRGGLVSWSSQERRLLPHQLLRSINIGEKPPDDVLSGYRRSGAWSIQHVCSQAAMTVEPFLPGQAIIERWLLPLFGHDLLAGREHSLEAQVRARGAVEVKAALYLIAKDTEPSWWQLTLRYDQDAKQRFSERLEHHVRVEPCFFARPIVSFRFLPLNEPVEFPS